MRSNFSVLFLEESQLSGGVFSLVSDAGIRQHSLSKLRKTARAVSRAHWDKNKSICSLSSSQLTGQICQIVFVTLTVLAVCVCHCAEF